MSMQPLYLEAVLALADARRHADFETGMRHFLPAVTAAPSPGWTLILAGTRSATPHPGGGARACYLNIWRVPDFGSLDAVGAILGPDPHYPGFEALIGQETQDFFVDLGYRPATAQPGSPPPPDSRHYLRLELNMTKDEARLRRHREFMTACVADRADSWMTSNRWTFVHGAWAHTGVLGRNLHVWASSAERCQAAAAVQWLMSEPGFADALLEEPHWDLWQRVDYQPGG